MKRKYPSGFEKRKLAKKQGFFQNIEEISSLGLLEDSHGDILISSQCSEPIVPPATNLNVQDSVGSVLTI